MNIRILPSGTTPRRLQYLTSFLVDETVAIDAGSIGYLGEPVDQSRVDHLFLTHTHADHTASLPVFLENREGEPLRIHGHPFVLQSLGTDIFNNRIWPDLLNTAPGEPAVMEITSLESEERVFCAGLTVTPVEVNHIVPTLGFIVEGPEATVVFGADSGPTERIWELARNRPNLRAVFMEASFPDRLEDYALRTGHLTPRLLQAEVAKLPPGISVVAVHIKPRFHDEVCLDLAKLGMDNLVVGTGGAVYRF